jgi:hypothetical protein
MHTASNKQFAQRKRKMKELSMRLWTVPYALSADIRVKRQAIRERSLRILVPQSWCF